MAQSGQIRGKVTEDQLIDLLDQVDQASANDSGAGKITVSIGWGHSRLKKQGRATDIIRPPPWHADLMTVHKEEDRPGRR